MSARTRSRGGKPNNRKTSASKLFDYDNDEAGPSNAEPILVLDDDDGNEMPALAGDNLSPSATTPIAAAATATTSSPATPKVRSVNCKRCKEAHLPSEGHRSDSKKHCEHEICRRYIEKPTDHHESCPDYGTNVSMKKDPTEGWWTTAYPLVFLFLTIVTLVIIRSYNG